MRMTHMLLVVLLALAATGPGSAQAAPAGDRDLPPGTVDSGVVSVDDLNKTQIFQIVIKGPNDSEKQAIVVKTILPPDWTMVESGRKKNSQELDPAIGMYTMIAKPPTEGVETDFVYELRVYSRNLLDDLDNLKDDKGKPIVIPAKDRTEKGMFSLYLNSMITEFVKRKYKTLTRQADIGPVPYGVIPDKSGKGFMLMGSRPEPMYFVPIRFQSLVDGSMIYTFSGVIGQKVVSLRFLVAKDQSEFYQTTIAMILNNTWGLTLEQEAKWELEMAKRVKEAKAKSTQQQGKNN